MISFVYMIHKDFQKKMTSFSFFKYFDAFELDVNVVNFVYYEKTQFYRSVICVKMNETKVLNFFQLFPPVHNSRLSCSQFLLIMITYFDNETYCMSLR